MNSASTHLFENVPISVGDALSTTFSIFIGNWKLLISLTLAMLGSLFAAGLVLFGVTFVAASAVIQKVLAILQNVQNQGGFARHLLEYSTGTSGASRLLENMYYNPDDDEFDFDPSDLFSAQFIITLIFLYLIWVVTVALICSVFQGAFTHALAEVYAGGTPTVGKSVKHGMGKMCNLFIYQLLLILTVTGLLLLIGFPTGFLAFNNDAGIPNFGVIFLGVLVFIVALAIVCSGLAAAIPAIVVESKTATQAFGRSWTLCKNFLGFIFCCQFSYHLAALIVTMIINKVLDSLPDFISLIGHICVSVLSNSIAPVICFVLYMSVRIRSENITQEDLALEIDSNVPLAHAVEMSPPGSKDSKGMYANVSPNSEMI